MSERALELRVGAVLVLAAIVLVGFVLVLGDVSFERGIRVDVEYAFSGAIQPGAPVKVSGVKVGRVDDIRFVPGRGEESDVQVQVALLLERRAQPVLTEGARFYINTQGLLGEHYVEIVPAKHPGAALPERAVVRGVDPPRFDLLFQRLYDFLGAISKLLENNEGIVEELVRSAAGLAKTVDQTLRTNQSNLSTTIDNAARATGEAATLLASLSRGVGDGQKLGATLDDVHAVTGLLRAELPTALTHIQEALRAVDRATSLLDAVPRDDVKSAVAGTRAALERANAILGDAQVIAQRMRAGSGTVGLLLTDDEIYDDLKDLLRDIKQHPWKLVWKD